MQATELQPNVAIQSESHAASAKPRLGFLGVGWIGLKRMEAIAQSGVAEISAIVDAAPENAVAAAAPFPTVVVRKNLDDLLALELDGIVIATPSALHAQQTITALGSGAAVFCQKPLGRNSEETNAAIHVARQQNRLLGVDLSYRYVKAIQAIRNVCASGELGEIYAADLTFQNAYGPDKPWFYDRKLSGGGCVIDLGIHLVDLALWILQWPDVRAVSSRLFAQGRPLEKNDSAVEDYAVIRIDLATGAVIRVECSWKLTVGCDAIIEGSFYGTKGGAAFRNVNGSFYQFEAARYSGTRKEILIAADPNEDWGSQAIVAWARRLVRDQAYDPEIEHLSVVTEILDLAYTYTQ